MSLLSKISIATSVLGTGIFLYRESQKAAENFWHKLKYSIDPTSIKIKPSITTTNISADLIVDNNYTADFNLEKLQLAVYYKKNDTLYLLGTTEPSTATYALMKNSRSTMRAISFDVNNLNAITGLSAVSKPAGERLLFKISGTINKLPLSTEFWY